MRTTLKVFAFLGLVTALYGAADPFIGVWKLNTGKSNLSKGSPPKDETIVIAAAGDQIEVTVSGTAADGSPLSGKYLEPAGGGAAKIEAGVWDGATVKNSNYYTRETTFMKGGKEASLVRRVVSKDKRTMRITFIRGVDPQGNPRQGTLVFEKQ
jgi:hypothetical protein